MGSPDGCHTSLSHPVACCLQQRFHHLVVVHHLEEAEEADLLVVEFIVAVVDERADGAQYLLTARGRGHAWLLGGDLPGGNVAFGHKKSRIQVFVGFIFARVQKLNPLANQRWHPVAVVSVDLPGHGDETFVLARIGDVDLAYLEAMDHGSLLGSGQVRRAGGP